MEEKRFTLRMDGELFKEISELAEKNRRSTAKEIEFAIAQYVHSLRHKELIDRLRSENPKGEKAKEAFEEIIALEDKYLRNGFDKDNSNED